MKKEIVISEANDLAVVFEDGRAAEFIIRSGEQLVGDIILGKVESVVPAIEAAFVNIGHEKNGFIHLADLPIPQRGKKHKPAQIKSGDKLIVQIAKAPTGTKGARLTGRISVPGRYLVFVPHDNRVCISRRITDSKERERLRRIAFTLKDPGHGLIVRTEAIGASEEELRRDIDELIERWAEILHEAQVRHSPALLYRDQDLLTRVLRDWLTADTERVVLEDREAFDKATELLSDWMPEMVKNLHLHRGKDGVMQHYKVHAELEAALKPTIRLPSGGSIVIEPTEALTVIDVNSGKLTQSKSLQDTVLRTNLEAATEIARQLRLRDIGGVIIIDFISMDHASDRKKVIAHLEEALKPDKSRPQITSQFSEHGLLEVARRRQGQSLTEQLTKPCPSCHGYGRVRNEVYSAAPVPATLEVAPPDEPEAIVEELIEEPIAGPDMRDSEPEPGAAAGSRGRGRGHAAARMPETPVAPAALPGVEGDLFDDVDDLGSQEGGVGGEDEGREGGRRRRRRRRRGRGRGGERAAEAAPLMTVVGAPSGEDAEATGDEYGPEPEEIELAESASGSGGPEGATEDEERRGRRRRRRRRGGRGRRGEGAEGVPPTSPLEPAVALAPQAGAARGFARPPGREQREARREVAELVPVGEIEHREPLAGDEPESRDRGRFGRERGERGGRERGLGFRDRGAREYGEPGSRSASGEPVEGPAGPAPVAAQVAGAPSPEAAPAAVATAPAARKLPRGITPHRPIVGPVQKTAPYQPKIATTRPRMELREVAPGVMQLVPVEEARPAAEAQAPAAQGGSATAVLSRATTEPSVAKAGTAAPPSETKAESLAAGTPAAAAPAAEAGAEAEEKAQARKPAARSAASRKKAEPKVDADSAPATQVDEAPEADTEAAEGKKPATRKRTTASATKTAASAPAATKARSTTSRARKPAATE